MMKGVKILAGSIFIFLWPYFQAQAQKKFSAESGEIRFTSNAQLEVIQASSSQLKGIIDSSSNQFAFRVNIVSFQGFNSSLQRDHFNENYLETEKYPTASFTGKIIEQIDWSVDGTYDVRAKGELEIHGQKQTRIIKSKVTIRHGKLDIESAFVVPLADHNISIPRIVSQKIATEIEIHIKAPMTVSL
jgi:polyisoprenoid-binding protein YceI